MNQSYRRRGCFISSRTVTFQFCVFTEVSNPRSAMTSRFNGGHCRLTFLLTVHRNLDGSHVTSFNQSYNVILVQGEIKTNNRLFKCFLGHLINYIAWFCCRATDESWCEILWLASVDLHFKEHIQNFLLLILRKFLIVGSSAPSHLVFGIFRFRTNI